MARRHSRILSSHCGHAAEHQQRVLVVDRCRSSCTRSAAGGPRRESWRRRASRNDCRNSKRIHHVVRSGARRGNRTHTVSPPPDFESGASTSSAIRACQIAQYMRSALLVVLPRHAAHATFTSSFPRNSSPSGPSTPRSASRLLALDGATGALRGPAVSRSARGCSRPRDLLVFNDTRVIPARVHGIKDSGGRIELLLERVLAADTALVHARASKRLEAGRPGAACRAATRAHARARGGAVSAASSPADVLRLLRGARRGAAAALHRSAAGGRRSRALSDRVCARCRARWPRPPRACTSTPRSSRRSAARGVRHAFVTLHVGAGTFQPVRVDDLEEHRHARASISRCRKPPARRSARRARPAGG